jgi:predicted dehydrogenase
MSRPADPGAPRIGMVGAGTMAAAHSAALGLIGPLYPQLGIRPRLVAVADIARDLASRVAQRFGYERVEDDWRSLVRAPDVDVVVACLPPAVNPEVILAAAAAGKSIVAEKPLASTADGAVELLRACRDAGVFHGLGAGYRWSPPVRALRALIDSGELGEVRSLRAAFLLDYAADPEVPLVWRFRRSLAGGGIAMDTGYHLIDCARYLVGEIAAVQGHIRTFITERPLPDAGAIGNRGQSDPADRTNGAARATGPVDVEDAAAAVVTFESGAYGVLETSRVAIGKKVSLLLEVFGSKGSADWDLERPDAFRVCLPAEDATFGYRRVLLNPSHPGAPELLIAGADGASLGWLGQECAMWAEFLDAIRAGRQAHADFGDGVRINAALDAWYASAATGERVAVTLPAGIDESEEVLA